MSLFDDVNIIRKEKFELSVSKVDISSLLSTELKSLNPSIANFNAFQIPVYFDWPFSEESEEVVRMGIKLIILEKPIGISRNLTLNGFWLPQCSNEFLDKNWYLHMRNFKRIVLSLAKEMKSEYAIEHLAVSNENRDDESSNEIYRQYRLIYYPGIPLIQSGLSYNVRENECREIITENAEKDFYKLG